MEYMELLHDVDVISRRDQLKKIFYSFVTIKLEYTLVILKGGRSTFIFFYKSISSQIEYPLICNEGREELV